ncbi:MAG: hypothetical protein GEU26_09435 [Nitrososphaeraceae archaeon]|nr:hypothetical protein [Nitrososphaeraceae archaeon]
MILRERIRILLLRQHLWSYRLQKIVFKRQEYDSSISIIRDEKRTTLQQRQTQISKGSIEFTYENLDDIHSNRSYRGNKMGERRSNMLPDSGRKSCNDGTPPIIITAIEVSSK